MVGSGLGQGWVGVTLGQTRPGGNISQDVNWN